MINRVREFREKQGLTQAELSRRIKTAAPSLSDVENGKRLPWPKIKKRLARTLKVSEKELFPEG